MNIKNIFSTLPVEVIGMVMRIIYTIIAFLIGVILARFLGPQMFSEYSYILAWIFIATSIATSGFPVLLVREVAAYNYEKKYELIGGLINAASLFVIFTSGLLITGVLLINSLGLMSSWDNETIILGISSLLFLSLTAIFESATRGLGYVLSGQISEQLIRPGTQLLFLILLISGIYLEILTTIVAFYVFTLATGLGFLVAFFILRNKRKNHRYLKKKYGFHTWYSSFWRLSFTGWMGVLSLQTNVIFLGLIGDATDIAKYRVAAQVASFIPFGLSVMYAIQIPALTKAYHTNDKLELQRLASRSGIISFLTALPIILATIFGSEELIIILFGSDYKGAGVILLILSVGQLVSASAGSVGLLMFVSREEHTVMITQGIVLTLNIILCLILIPIIGVMGAAIATTATLIIRNIYLIFFIYRKMGVLFLPIIIKNRPKGKWN